MNRELVKQNDNYTQIMSTLKTKTIQLLKYDEVLGPVCFSIWMNHLDKDESFVYLCTKSVTHSDGSSE